MNEEVLEGPDDGLNWIVAALLEGAEDAHQHGLAVGAALTPGAPITIGG